MADAIIEVKDVEFRYEGAEEEAVAGVSLRVERGEFVAVLGRNGHEFAAPHAQAHAGHSLFLRALIAEFHVFYLDDGIGHAFHPL